MHADSLQSFLLAVVVPNYALLRRESPGKSDEELRAFCGPLLLAEIAKCAVSHGLEGYECPRGAPVASWFEKCFADKFSLRRCANRV